MDIDDSKSPKYVTIDILTAEGVPLWVSGVPDDDNCLMVLLKDRNYWKERAEKVEAILAQITLAGPG